MPSRINLLVTKELTETLSGCPHCVWVDCERLTGREAVALRTELRAKAMRLNVVKNSLAARALEAGGFPGLGERLSRPSALLTGGEDMPAACKTITEWIKKNKKLAVKGGFCEGRVLDARAVEQLALLPPKPVLLAQFIGSVQGVAQRVAGSFQSLLASIGRALEEVRKQKEAAEGGAPAGEGT